MTNRYFVRAAEVLSYHPAKRDGELGTDAEAAAPRRIAEKSPMA